MSEVSKVKTKKFTLFQINRGYLLTTYIDGQSESYSFSDKERFTAFKIIDQLMGPEPDDSIGMEEPELGKPRTN